GESCENFAGVVFRIAINQVFRVLNSESFWLVNRTNFLNLRATEWGFSSYGNLSRSHIFVIDSYNGVTLIPEFFTKFSTVASSVSRAGQRRIRHPLALICNSIPTFLPLPKSPSHQTQ